MASSSLNREIKKKILSVGISVKEINRIAIQCGFVKREYRKISPVKFVQSFFLVALNKSNTYLSWAEQISILTGATVSKQAVWGRIHSGTVQFVKTLLGKAMSGINYGKPQGKKIFKSFNRVLTQDSTILHLPDKLRDEFPGNHSRGKKKACARVQAVYDLLKLEFVFFQLGAFTRNDQKASKDILDFIRKKDLIIRDLGYFVLNVFATIMAKKADFLSRLKTGVHLYDLQTKEQINLVKAIRGQGVWDKKILLGKEDKIELRVVAIRLPEKIAAERKRKARQDRDRRLNHSKNYYTLLEYSIYITSVDDSIWSAQDIMEAYGERWKIEIIFKAWKSHFSIEKMIPDECKTRYRIEVFIYLMLLFIVLFHARVYLNEILSGKQYYDAENLSLLKMASFFTRNFVLLTLTQDLAMKSTMISYFCKKEKRQKVEKFP